MDKIRINKGKVFAQVREVKQVSSKNINKREVFTIIERTLWLIDNKHYIKYEGAYHLAYPFNDGSGYYNVHT